MLQALDQKFRSRFQQFMDKRLPAARSITLNQQRIFIFPSRAGLAFLVTLGVILLVAINYQTNMVFAMTFLLLSAFIVTILHTFANFTGLSITAVKAYPTFAGGTARFDIKVSRHQHKSYYDIVLRWPESEVSTVSLENVGDVTVSLHLPAERRGVLVPPRLLVETYYPLGLLRCWTWLALDVEAIIYPRPLPSDWQEAYGGDTEEGEAAITEGSDDFYAFKNYQPGDPLKHIAWKPFAKGQPLQTKQFAAYREQRYWLDWQAFAGDKEARLSAMCYWALQLEKQQQEYGVRLPGTEIAPNTGELHRDKVLKTLALFEVRTVGGAN